MTLRDKYPNRDSVISIESNHSFGASSISSIPSYISSIDSASVCSPMTASESEGHSKTDRRFADPYGMETGVPPTIAEESSTDDGVFYSTKGRRVRSLNHLGKPKHLKKVFYAKNAPCFIFLLCLSHQMIDCFPRDEAFSFNWVEMHDVC